MTKKDVICPNCNKPVGKFPRDKYISVRMVCWNCATLLTVKPGYVLGSKVPETISLESNQAYVDMNAYDDPIDELNSEIDRKFILDKLEPLERKICIMLEQGYLYKEIGKKLKMSDATVTRIIAKLRKRLNENTD